jgi:ricin-type beta-trefoil lectin protein
VNTIKRKVTGIATAVLLSASLTLALPSPASAATLGPYRIIASGTNQCLDVRDVSLSNGAYLQLYHCLPYQYNQQFYLYEAGRTWRFQIVAAHSGKCLDVKDVSQSNGAHIQQWDCLGWSQTNQLFDDVDAGGGNSLFRAVHSGKCISYFLPVADSTDVIQFPCYTQWQIVNW